MGVSQGFLLQQSGVRAQKYTIKRFSFPIRIGDATAMPGVIFYGGVISMDCLVAAPRSNGCLCAKSRSFLLNPSTRSDASLGRGVPPARSEQFRTFTTLPQCGGTPAVPVKASIVPTTGRSTRMAPKRKDAVFSASWRVVPLSAPLPESLKLANVHRNRPSFRMSLRRLLSRG